MKPSLLGSLHVRRVVKGGQPSENAGKTPLTVVLLHGFGAPGSDLVGLADGLDVPAGTTFVFPEAPLDLAAATGQRMFGEARAWWLIDFARLERAIATGELRDLSADVPEGLAEARVAVMSMLDALAKESPDGPIVLGGFSQGAMLTLDVAVRDHARALAGVVLLSGTLIAERDWAPLLPNRRGLPAFQSHGKTDPILPFSIAERLRDMLVTAGLDVTFDPFGGPHTIPLPTLGKLGAFLTRIAASS